MVDPEPEQGTVAPPMSLLARLAGYVANGLKYWEPRRIVYNGILLLVVATHFLLGLPSSSQKLTFDVFLVLFFLAVLANIAYCAAYAPDLFVQFSGLDAPWRKGRVILLVVGTAFAATITHFFAKGLFGTE